MGDRCHGLRRQHGFGTLEPLNPVFLSFFISPMSDELGWSRTAISLGMTVRLLAAAVTAPLIGPLIDRFGARWLGVFAGLIAGTSLIALSRVHDLWLFYLLFAATGSVGLWGGPGSNLLAQVPVAKWFVAKRGRAMTISATGMAVGTVVGIPLLQWLLTAFGWRIAWLVYGVILAGLVIPTFALFMRRSPEDLGMQPDGMTIQYNRDEKDNASGVAIETDWTMPQALRSRTLWIILSAMALLGLALSGTTVHRVAFWEGLGMSPGLVAIGTAADPLVAIFSALAFGIASERTHLRYFGLIGGGGFALAMIPTVFATGHPVSILAHNIVFGAAAGAYLTVNNLIWPNYFGRK